MPALINLRDVSPTSKIRNALYSWIGVSDQRFVLVVRDKAGLIVDVSHYSVDSLDSAALLGHAFQSQNGDSALILDRSTTPATEYLINDRGKPFPV